MKAWRRIVSLPSVAAIAAVRAYQLTLSPWLGKNCRFHPSCSQYTIEAIRKYGVVLGCVKGAWRIARCNPFCQGGYDPP